jgi:4-amino-4-deoxy-L-arabinose transferase-like glycosyltransferase
MAKARIIFLLVAAAIVYLAGNASVSLWDRDEPRYAQCSRQMLQSGDWVVPRLYDEIRANKPPLIYWCQATAMRLFGDGPVSGTFAARFPSTLAMILTLIILGVAVSRHVGADQAFWTVFVLASSLLTVIAAKLAFTDSVLLLFGTIAQLSLYVLWRGSRSWKPLLLLAIALGLGALTKPLVLLTVGGTMIVLLVFSFTGRDLRIADESGQHLSGRQWAARILVAIAFFTLIVIPWLLLVRHRAPEFLGKATAEARAHLESGKEGHRFPPGYHLLLIWVTFFPWCLLLPLAIGLGIRYRQSPQVRFALAAVIGPWLVLEFFGTKLPHYILATFPALAYLTAHAILRCLRGADRDLQSRPFLIGAAAWTVIVAVLPIILWLFVPGFHLPHARLPKFGEQPYAVIIALTALAPIYAMTVAILLLKRRPAPALLTLGSGMLAILLLIFAGYLPRAQFLRASIHVAAVLDRLGATHPGDVLMIDYKEPSLGFYQGGTIREEKSNFLLPKHWDQWPRWMVLTRDAFDGAPPESRDRLRVVADPDLPFRAWAYADGGRTVELLVVERK